MANVPRWGGLRPEPYDPDARDADNDGIVQEGTAWERPAGTRLLDELGRDIQRGSTSVSRPRGLQVLDATGTRVDYTPTYGTAGREVAPGTTEKWRTQKLGAPSLKDRGLPSLADIVHGPDQPARPAATPAPVEAITPSRPAVEPLARLENPGSFDDIRDALDELAAERIEFNSQYADPIHVIESPADGSLMVVEWDGESTDVTITDATEWVVNQNLDDYFPDYDLNWNDSFWSERGMRTIYHATSDDRLTDIAASGLQPGNETRGLSNRWELPAVYTSTNSAVLEAYGDTVIEIDLDAMRADGITPFAAQEPDIRNYELETALAYQIGLYDHAPDVESGMDPDTVVLQGEIPAKYLSVDGRPLEVEPREVAERSTTRIATTNSATTDKPVTEYTLDEAIAAYPEMFDLQISEYDAVRDIARDQYGIIDQAALNHLGRLRGEWSSANFREIEEANAELIRRNRKLFDDLVAGTKRDKAERKLLRLPLRERSLLRELAFRRWDIEVRQQEAVARGESFARRLESYAAKSDAVIDGTTVPTSAARVSQHIKARDSDEFTDILERLNNVHGLDPDGGAYETVLHLADVDEESQGRFYHPTSKTADKGISGGHIAVDPIKVFGDPPSEVGIGQQRVVAIHEIGHRVDFFVGEDGKSQSYVEEGLKSGSPAVMKLFTTLRSSSWWPRYQEKSAEWEPEYRSYSESPVELWARMYAQWLTINLEDDRSWPGIAHGISQFTQWDNESFAELYPLVEDVLRERKLIA